MANVFKRKRLNKRSYFRLPVWRATIMVDFKYSDFNSADFN